MSAPLCLPRRLLYPVSLTLLFFVLMIPPAYPEDGLDEKAIELLLQITTFYEELEHFSFKCKSQHQFRDVAGLSNRDLKKFADFESEGHFLVSRPNRLKVTLIRRDKTVELCSDGHSVLLQLPYANSYTEMLAPDDFRQAFTENRYQAMDDFFDSFPVFKPLLRTDAYPALIEQTEKLQYLGVKRMQNRLCHHLRMRKRPSQQFDLWVDTGQQPWIRKVSIAHSSTKDFSLNNSPSQYSSMLTERSFYEWQRLPAPSRQAFTIDIPYGARHLNSIEKNLKREQKESYLENLIHLLRGDAQAETLQKKYLYGNTPIPSNNRALTQSALQKQLHHFYQRLLLGTYTGKGMKDPSWDSALQDYLTQFVLFFQKRPETNQISQMITDGQKLHEQGCNEPLLYFCRALALRRFGKITDAQALFEQSYSGFQKRKYPQFLQAYTAASIAECLVRAKTIDQITINHWQQQGVTHLAQSAVDGSFRKDEERLFLTLMHQGSNYWRHVFRNTFTSPKIEEQVPWRALYQQLRKIKNVPSYIKNVTGGLFYKNSAKHQRQIKLASAMRVESSSLKDKASHHARSLLQHAWQAKPHYPEAPAAMISLAKLKANEKSRDWFDRAVKAQLDYMPAYEAYAQELEKDPAALYIFGLECLQTKRYDTQTPLFYLKVIQKLAPLMEEPLAIYEYSQVYQQLVSMFEQAMQRKSSEASTNHELSYIAFLAWCHKDYDRARKIHDTLIDRVDMTMIPQSYNANLITGEIYAKTGRHKDSLQTAENLAKEGKEEKAINIYQALLTREQDFMIQHYLQNKIHQLQAKEIFIRHQWISFLPEPGMIGWQNQGGEWDVSQSGQAIGEVKKGSARLHYQSGLQGNFELRGIVDFLKATPPITAYIHLPFSENATLTVKKDNNLLLIGPSEPGDYLRLRVSVHPRNQFYLQYWSGRVTLFWNGEAVWKEEPLDPSWSWWQNRTDLLGFSISSHQPSQNVPGARIAFQFIELRSLSHKPDAYEWQIPQFQKLKEEGDLRAAASVT